MMELYTPDMIEGVAVYKDEKLNDTFYVLPNTPRFRLDERGIPVFKFLKYKLPVDRPDGKKGGGFVIFDTEFVVPDDTMKKVKEELQERLRQKFKGQTPPPVKIGTLTFKRGTASLQFLDKGGVLVESVQNPQSPSLYGRYITPFTVELSPAGVAVAEGALTGQGGSVQVIYSLWADVKLPPINVVVWFNASKFYEFTQSIDMNDRICAADDFTEQLHERFAASESGNVDIDTGAVSDRKIVDAVTDWAWRTLEDGIKRMVLGDIAPVSEEGRKAPEGYEHIRRNVRIEKIASFRRSFTQGQAMEWDPHPQGTLPNITQLKDKDGKPLKWENFKAEINADDPFFKQLNVAVRVNADFQKYSIFSVKTHLEYKKKNGTKEVKDITITKPDDVGKFATYVEDGNTKYTYWYEVSYKGASKTFKSPPKETEETDLQVNLDDSGVLALSIVAGDLDFEQMRAAQVTIQYEDKTNSVPLITQQFTLDQGHLEHNFLKVIFQPIRNKLKYQVKYIMKDGKEYKGEWVEQDYAPQIIINDMWAATRTVGVRATGDLENRVEAIFLDLNYADEANKYAQTKSVVLNQENPFVDWSFPVITETGGKVTYSGTIKYKDGTEEEVKPAETTKNTLLVGPQVLGYLEVEVLPDLLDFDQIKLALIKLQYKDPAHGIDVKQDVKFRPGTTEPFQWKVELKDKTLLKYQWQAVYFLVDGSTKKTSLATSDDETLVPQLPG